MVFIYKTLQPLQRSARLRASLRLCLLLGAAFAPASAAFANENTIPDYRGDCRRIADRMLADVFRDPEDWVRRQRKHAVISHAALVQAQLWQWTREEKYARGAEAFLNAVANNSSSIREADFFTVYPFAKAFQILRHDDKISTTVEARAIAFMKRCFRARDVADHNQAFTRAAGLAVAAKLMPRAPRANQWRKYAEDVWALWMKLGDITENASNYNRIDAAYVFLLADELGTVDDLRDPRVHSMYRRWSQQVSSSGTMPAYGDSGSGPLAPNPNWPRINAWGQWPPGLERAAVLFQDSTLQWTARRIYQRGMASEPLGRRYFHVLALSALMRAADWAQPVKSAPQAPMPGPLLLTRRDKERTDAVDKLVLTPSRMPGSPFLFMELYSRGFHAHVNQHGAINWFETGNIPHLVHLGYNNRAPHHANQLVLYPDDERGFPHRQTFAADQWQTTTLPLSRLPSLPGQPHMKRIPAFGLRTATSTGVTLWVDNLRLVGPRKQQVIEGFESPNGWSYSPHTSGMSREGEYALVWQMPRGAHLTGNDALSKRLSRMAIDSRNYDRLQLDWKLSSNHEKSRPLIVRAGEDFHAHVPQLAPTLQATQVNKNEAGDQHGLVRYGNWFTRGSRHQRRMVLTREGALVVWDRLWPGSEALGMVAGPVWHLGPRSAPVVQASTEADAFHVTGAGQSLLVRFSRGPSSQNEETRQFGIASADVWSIQAQKTAFARETVRDKKPLDFITVFVPHSPKTRWENLNNAIQFALDSPESASGRTDSVVKVRLATEQSTIRVQFLPDGMFVASRDP